MKIYVVRHAWAGDRDESRWPDDDLRPLTEQGRKRFRQFAKRLVKGGLEPARIATSPLVRCRQTAEILLEHLPKSTSLEALDALRPDSLLDALLAWTNQTSGEDVAWVGHAPDVGLLTAALIGGPAMIRFAKGAAAAVRFDGPVEPGHGQLQWLATARILDC